MSRNTIRFTAMCVSVWALLSAAPAFAYLDPGTGSAILQGVLAALAAIAVTAKLYWHRLLALLGLKKRKSEKQAPSAVKAQSEGSSGDSN